MVPAEGRGNATMFRPERKHKRVVFIYVQESVSVFSDMRIRIFPAFPGVMVAASMSVLTGCALIGTQTERSSGVPIDYSPSETVRRQESLQIAESYRSHQWRPAKENIFHGNDAQGIRVDDLLPGDVVNKHNSHVLLFVEFMDAEKTRFLAYETGSPPTWKVLRHPIEVAYVENLGYRPFRYRGIRD